MKVLRISNDDDYPSLSVSPNDILKFARNLTVGRHYDGDHDFEMVYGEEGDKFSSFSDFIRFVSSGILVNQKLYSALKSRLKGCGQWIPLKYKDNYYYYLNVIVLSDILNSEQSTFYEENGERLDIIRCVLNNPRESHPNIFKLKEFPSMATYVTEDFYQHYKDKGYTGIKFKEVETV